MAAYVQKQLDLLQRIPVEVRRKLETIRVLDEQIVGIKREVVHQLDEERNSKRVKVSKTTEEALEKNLQKMRNLQNQKIEIARNLHEHIGQGVQQVERDLRSLRAQIEEEKRLGIHHNKRQPSTTEQTNKMNQRTMSLSNYTNNAKSNIKKRKKNAGANQDKYDADNDSTNDLDIYSAMDYGKILSPQLGGLYGQLTPVGLQFQAQDIPPDEPRYCICNQISYGGMVMCDNEDCKIQWFHFECVGLPENADVDNMKWYCPDCRDGTNYEKPKKT